jgi:hypothetical protein
MKMISDTEEELRRESKAISTFVKLFNGRYEKLSSSDIDYKIFDSSNKLIAYVEVVSRFKSIKDPYPLPIHLKKLIKLSDKILNPTIIWSCDDGIIYGKLRGLVGQIKYGSHPLSEQELYSFFDKQKEFKYVRYS